MEIEFWRSEGREYIYTKLKLLGNSEKEYFEKLKLRIVVENEKIKTVITKILDKYDIASHGRAPHLPDKKEEEKVRKLLKAKSTNVKSIETLKNLTNYDDCIICEQCGELMYRTPLNISFTKVGHSFIIDRENKFLKIDYFYKCDNPKCHYSIGEMEFEHGQNNLRRRQDLLDAGESFVPNKHGFWHWENDKKDTKPESLNDFSYI